MKENGFTLKNGRKRPNLTKTITDEDDLGPFANIPAQIKSLRQSLNSGKTDFIHFDKVVAIIPLNSKSLKLVDQSICLGSNISSTERYRTD